MANNFVMKIVEQSDKRIIIHVNGHEIDINTNLDGISVDITDGNKHVAELGYGWP